MDHLTFSIVIPCRDEAENIGGVLAGLHSLQLGQNVVVVDDGSTDGTADVVERFPWVDCVRLDCNQGKGCALVHGIKRARGDYIVFMDGDGQDPPAEVPRLMAAAREGSDFVIGSKFLGDVEPGALGLVNFLGNRGLSLILNALFRTEITDSQSGFRCIRASFLRETNFRSRSYDIESEMLVRALNARLTVREVPVRRAARLHGETGLRPLPDGWRILRTILCGRLLR